VNISGTFAKDKRPDNGLDAIAEQLNANRLQRIAVVGIIAYHAHHEVVGRPETVSVHFEAIEPTEGDADEQTRQILDQMRKGRGLGNVELTLFDETPRGGEERDPTAGPWPGDAEFVAPPSAVAAGDAVEGPDGAEDDGPNSDRTPDVWLDDNPPAAPEPKARRRKSSNPPDSQ
jgi:hypothetical protein